MDTKLKKGKKIRSFIYRIVAAGAFFAMIATGLLGREAVANLYAEGIGTLTGKVYYLTEFREYIASVYTLGMMGYAGIGDDKGYPLTDENAIELTQDAIKDFRTRVSLTNGDILYHIQYGETVMESNISFPVFSEFDGHLLLPEDVNLCCYWDGETGRLKFFSHEYNGVLHDMMDRYYNQQYKPNTEQADNIKFLLAVKDSAPFSSQYTSVLAGQAIAYRNLLIAILACAGVTLLSWLGCLFTIKAGKQARADYLRLVSKVWLEIRLVFVSGMLCLCYILNLWNFGAPIHHRIPTSGNWGFYIPVGMLIYLLYLDLSGNGLSLLKQSLTYSIYSHFRRYHTSLPWYRKAINMYYVALVSALVLMITGTFALAITRYSSWLVVSLGILLLGILLLLVSFRLKRLVNDTSVIANKLSAISAGKSSAPVTMKEHSLLTQAAHDLNAVGNGIEAAIEQNNRSNKMRVELITNVSHDLKTPLTSIINYADLLCEENLPEPAAAYAQSLRDKSYRLKSMVQDVFDLSKATSGNLNVEKTRLDLAKLIRQTLADMDERITESNLIFKLNITSEPLYIEADGEKLYRVFQNLIINALQYSLDNSRVHILLEEHDKKAYARIKNTSRQELNFTAEEIMERFVRADSSRTTEGSGLGLSIVQSFTEACGGTFTIEMDADLFTACVAFPLIADPQDNMQPCEMQERGIHEENT